MCLFKKENRFYFLENCTIYVSFLKFSENNSQKSNWYWMVRGLSHCGIKAYRISTILLGKISLSTVDYYVTCPSASIAKFRVRVLKYWDNVAFIYYKERIYPERSGSIAKKLGFIYIKLFYQVNLLQCKYFT